MDNKIKVAFCAMIVGCFTNAAKITGEEGSVSNEERKKKISKKLQERLLKARSNVKKKLEKTEKNNDGKDEFNELVKKLESNMGNQGLNKANGRIADTKIEKNDTEKVAKDIVVIKNKKKPQNKSFKKNEENINTVSLVFEEPISMKRDDEKMTESTLSTLEGLDKNVEESSIENVSTVFKEPIKAEISDKKIAESTASTRGRRDENVEEELLGRNFCRCF